MEIKQARLSGKTSTSAPSIPVSVTLAQNTDELNVGASHRH